MEVGQRAARDDDRRGNECGDRAAEDVPPNHGRSVTDKYGDGLSCSWQESARSVSGRSAAWRRDHLQQTVSGAVNATDPVVAGLKPTGAQPVPVLTALYATMAVFLTFVAAHVVVSGTVFPPARTEQSPAEKSDAVCVHIDSGKHVHMLQARLSVAAVPAVFGFGYAAGHDCAPVIAAQYAMPVGFGAQTCVPPHPLPKRTGGAQIRPSVMGEIVSVVAASQAAGGLGGCTTTVAVPFEVVSELGSAVQVA
jgi:hypothetical protein